jgi:NAD(P)-dependent dehydrogenase (short-subunit alcohol dehydrogenase family)
MSTLGMSSLASLLVFVSAILLQSGGAAPSAPSGAKGTVLVTGANRGIGLALAKEFRAAGYEVIGTARNPEEAKELAATGARVVALDVTSAESVRALAEGLTGQPIDILVNNAGVGLRNDSIDTLDIAEVERVLAVNTIGPMRVTQALLPNLRLGSRKVVASISSRLASIEVNSSGDYIGYRESKTALNQFMRTLAVELKAEGFICIALSPGWVRTDMGGSSAPLGPEESAAGLRSVIEGLTPEKSGSFLAYDGAMLPW